MAFPKCGLPLLCFRIKVNFLPLVHGNSLPLVHGNSLPLVHGNSLVGGAVCWTDCSTGGKETELWEGKQWTGLKKFFYLWVIL